MYRHFQVLGTLNNGSQPGWQFQSPTGHVAMTEDIFGCYSWDRRDGSAISIQRIEASDFANHPSVHSTEPPVKNSNVAPAGVEKACWRLWRD
jgi:hypothetical protein